MLDFARMLVVLHVVADTIWIGSILAVVALLVRPSPARDQVQAGRDAAAYLYVRIANPAFMAAFAFGALRLLLDLRAYFVLSHFMHAKLTLAFVVVGLHHVIGARAKRLAKTPEAPAGALRVLGYALLGFSALTIYFAVVKPF
jgi:putative membrane protein